MKACVTSSIPARSIQRISHALAQYAPIEVTNDANSADLVVHLVIGVGNFESTPIDKIIHKELLRGQRYAIVQCCLISTEEKKPDFWKSLWEDAEVVWSYLDLRAFAPTYDFNFYYAPLGVDKVFYDRQLPRDITMLTTGYVAESEAVREVSEAVRRVDGYHVHVGPNFGLGPHSRTYMDVSDEEMAHLYSRSQFVAGLRRDEGFELPAAEGLICGAQPIMFDAPHYRQWFDKWATFIPEGDFATVTDAIENVFYQTPKKFQPNGALEMFDWERIVAGFWSSILEK